VNRLVSMLMLATFAAQHFACCCSGLGTHACEQNQCATEKHPGWEATCRASEIDVHSSCCGHDHAAGDAPKHSEHDESPANGSHGHHVCVGTHVFFVTAPRASLPPSNLSQDYGFSPADGAHFVTMTSSKATIRDTGDSSPPLTSSARRSTLCVYRI